ncbi:MAG TPA: adenylate/guanylate cyclase domain-containing protein [Chthoniobacteraceae bacterium]|nr:adenylate/guanylate cyclase domain-containing protein [Chthoniobacteraceae bacterium]
MPATPDTLPPAARRRPRLTAGRLRSLTGLVIGLYVVMHLANHSLGLISLQAQESARPWIMTAWQSWVGQFLLYGSLFTHAGLGLHSVSQRRHFRLPKWEAAQIALGLAIPYLLLVHIMNTRGTRITTGIDINYEYEVANLWIDPWMRFRQVALVLLVWGHFTAGLHYWLRLRPWYRRNFHLILAAFIFVPAMGLLGFAETGKIMTAKARAEPAWFKWVTTHGVPADPVLAHRRALLKQWAGPSWLALVALVFAGTQLRNRREGRRLFSVTYPDDRCAKAPVGMTVLEVSRMIRRPHMSICGGRGRCTTCRIRVHQDAGQLPPPGETELRALARLGAPEGIRLACQLRPRKSVFAQPLVDPHGGGSVTPGLPGQSNFGEEKCVTVMFLDVRGSTKLAEHRLPFDVVFLMSHFFAEMATAVENAGGHYSNFTGDGLMALFGMEGDLEDGAMAALKCALDMLERLERINRRMAGELETPLAIGIGIHTGDAIVGRMGPPKTPILTALGDTVNTTARLESMTKELGAPVVASLVALTAAGVDINVPIESIQLKGRSTPLEAAVLDLDALALCLIHEQSVAD